MLLSAPGQFWTTLGWSFWTEQEEAFFVPSLRFRNDLSQGMRHGYVMDGFVLLCFSIFYSFAAILSALFLKISITLHISAKFAVSVHAWPKGGKKPFFRHWIPFPHPHILLFMMFFFFHDVVTMWHYFLGRHNIASHSNDCFYWNFDSKYIFSSPPEIVRRSCGSIFWLHLNYVSTTLKH